MERLFGIFRKQLDRVPDRFCRSLIGEIDWSSRLIGIKGPRGTGKTVLLLQYIKNNLPKDHTVLYVSLDNIWFDGMSLAELADQFSKRGGKHLILDEVHKYPDWSRHLKTMYDSYPELQVIFTGSSLLEILNARADLSRRAVVYHMQGLSFREFMELKHEISLPGIDLQTLLTDHLEISKAVLTKIRPLETFQEYLRTGYFPFFMESEDLYSGKLREIINMIIEIELPQLRGIDIGYVSKLKQLLGIIATSVPFKPNISKLSERIGIDRITLMSYLHFLNDAQLISNLYRDNEGISRLQKPDKIFLDNPNMHFAFSGSQPDIGTIRETFFLNQLSYSHQLEYGDGYDFLVDGEYAFEIGGMKKGKRQLPEGLPGFIASDNIEYGFDNKVPLWQFGLLY